MDQGRKLDFDNINDDQLARNVDKFKQTDADAGK